MNYGLLTRWPDATAEAAGAVPHRLLSKAEVARYLGTSTRNINRLVAAGLLPPPLRLGRKLIRWMPEEIEAALAKVNRTAPSPERLVRPRRRRRGAAGVRPFPPRAHAPDGHDLAPAGPEARGAA